MMSVFNIMLKVFLQFIIIIIVIIRLHSACIFKFSLGNIILKYLFLAWVMSVRRFFFIFLNWIYFSFRFFYKHSIKISNISSFWRQSYNIAPTKWWDCNSNFWDTKMAWNSWPTYYKIKKPSKSINILGGLQCSKL